MVTSKVSTRAIKWSEGLSNSVSIIIGRYVDHFKFAAFMAVPLITSFHVHFCFSILYNYICLYVSYATV
jgi:hypothetical protein